MNDIEIGKQYARDVRDGKVVVGRFVKLAVDRYFRDLEFGHEKGYFFDDEDAKRYIKFFQYVSLSKGDTEGRYFKLEPWQTFLVMNIFGWKKTVNGKVKRKYKEAYVQVPKKNGKTSIAAALGLSGLIIDRENGPEVCTAAYTREQARQCFDEAQSMVRFSSSLSNRAHVYANSIVVPATRGSFKPVSNEAKTKEGKNTHFGILDEYHLHTNDKVRDSIQTGMVARSQPFFFIITTAGDDKNGPCYAYRNICIDVLESRASLDDVFILIYEIDEGDDWKDPAIWAKANPNLGVSVTMDGLQSMFAKALLSGVKEVEFKTKHLDMWVDAAVTWIPSETWDSMANPDFIPPQGAICYGGIDLGKSRDMSAFALYFPEYKYLKVKYYVPEESAEFVVRGRVNYKEWIRQGYVTATPGKTTDYGFIIEDILKAAEQYELNFVGFDPYGSSFFKDKLRDDLGVIYAGQKQSDGEVKYGYHERLQPFRQGFVSMGPPTKSFEEKCVNTEMIHDGNPITSWMLGNVSIDTDAAGNMKVVKNKSRDKVDGIVASIMAIGEFEHWGNYIDTNEEWYA